MTVLSLDGKLKMTENMLAAFGRALSEAIRRSGKTQVSIAGELGVSDATLSTWKLGHVEPPRGVVYRLERILDLRPGELSVHLDYLPATGFTASWESALISDPEIDPALRDTILAILRNWPKD